MVEAPLTALAEVLVSAAPKQHNSKPASGKPGTTRTKPANQTKDIFASPSGVRDWLRLQLAGRAHSIFMALWLDAQNRLLAADELFRGTLTQTSVYPREVVKTALAHNAAAVIFRPQPPFGHCRTFSRRRNADSQPEKRH